MLLRHREGIGLVRAGDYGGARGQRWHGALDHEGVGAGLARSHAPGNAGEGFVLPVERLEKDVDRAVAAEPQAPDLVLVAVAHIVAHRLGHAVSEHVPGVLHQVALQAAPAQQPTKLPTAGDQHLRTCLAVGRA